MKTWDLNKIELQEQFKVLLINMTGRVLGIYETSTGGLNATVADIRLILAAAIKSLSTTIVLCHNHPSGNLQPSRPDQFLTSKIKDAASYFDIRLMDHIIISPDGYYSFSDEGLL